MADFGFIIDIQGHSFGEAPEWIQAFPIGTWQHPVHGKIAITPDKVAKLAANVHAGIRGQDLDIDYDHKAKDGTAAGWVRDAEARTDGLYLKIEWTEKAREHIANREYRYFSPEFTER